MEIVKRWGIAKPCNTMAGSVMFGYDYAPVLWVFSLPALEDWRLVLDGGEGEAGDAADGTGITGAEAKADIASSSSAAKPAQEGGGGASSSTALVPQPVPCAELAHSLSSNVLKLTLRLT